VRSSASASVSAGPADLDFLSSSAENVYYDISNAASE
jgi:hypothetical protein